MYARNAERLSGKGGVVAAKSSLARSNSRPVPTTCAPPVTDRRGSKILGIYQGDVTGDADVEGQAWVLLKVKVCRVRFCGRFSFAIWPSIIAALIQIGAPNA